jgi:hypothetical protein
MVLVPLPARGQGCALSFDVLEDDLIVF